MNLLDFIPMGSTRRNHGLEHATIHVLNERFPHVHLAGRATHDGYLIYGEVPTEAVVSAAQEALSRMRAGETHLAVHPRCGTNIVVAGLLAGLSSFAASYGKERPAADKLSRMILATTGALLLAQPLGPIVQEKLTTSPNQLGVRIKGVKRQQFGKMVVHKVDVER